MGWTQKRKTKGGAERFRACYRDIRGPIQSAGTFAKERDADKAWQRAELKIAEGRVNDPRRGRQTFRHYVTEEWLPHHVIEAITREAYTYQIGKHILPWFGPMRMNEIMPSHVREWVTDLQAKGVTPATIQKVRFILSAIFTTAMNDVTFLHPCKGVKTPTVPRKPLKIITPEQFDTIYAALPDAISRLLIETDIETGLRWGELTELRVEDLDPVTRILTREPGGCAGRPEVPPRWPTVPCQGIPQGWGVPPPQAQHAAREQARSSYQGRRPWPGRSDLRDAAAGLPRGPASGGAGPGGAGVHQTQRCRSSVPARDDERLQRRQVPVRVLH